MNSVRNRIQGTPEAEAVRESRLGRAGYMSLMIIGFVLLFFKVGAVNFAHVSWPVISAQSIVGLSIQITGLAFAVWARRALGKNWTGRPAGATFVTGTLETTSSHRWRVKYFCA